LTECVGVVHVLPTIAAISGVENSPVVLDTVSGMADAVSWESFYLMVGGAAAALTGLIFVAVSLYTRSVMGSRLLRDRAWSSIALLMSQLFMAMAVLVPSQPRPQLGLEIDLIALFWVYRTLRVLAIAMIGMFGSGISSSWVLISEVPDKAR
jgi:hypothetical protein